MNRHVLTESKQSSHTDMVNLGHLLVTCEVIINSERFALYLDGQFSAHHTKLSVTYHKQRRR